MGESGIVIVFRVGLQPDAEFGVALSAARLRDGRSVKSAAPDIDFHTDLLVQNVWER